MRRMLPWIFHAALLTAFITIGCSAPDYDISEVATPEYLGLEEKPDNEYSDEGDPAAGFTNPYPWYDSSFLCVDSHQSEDLMEDGGSPEICLHDAGERNHGTGWFFNQPWAATFIWSKILRDAVILLVLAVVVLLVSDRTLSHRRRR